MYWMSMYTSSRIKATTRTTQRAVANVGPRGIAAPTPNTTEPINRGRMTRRANTIQWRLTRSSSTSPGKRSLSSATRES